MMQKLYPLKFKPIPREMIWGGENLRNLFNKPFPAGSKIGESWEISGVKGNISLVSNGFLAGNNLSELAEVYMGDLVGERIFDKYGEEFPLLIKLIDASEVLSVQVHPGDELAAERHGGRGKTEMWYVLDAVPGAELISGFKAEVSKDLFLQKMKDGNLSDILNVEKVSRGDVFFIPAGRVHAIGKGIVLAEIQQASDITYRLYDWDRTDASGNRRQLHQELAVEAIDFKDDTSSKRVLPVNQSGSALLADCKYFTSHRYRFGGKLLRDYSLLDSFVIIMCASGALTICDGSVTVEAVMGDTLLIPAVTEELTIEGGSGSEFLEIYVKS